MKEETNIAQYLYTIYILFIITLLSYWLNPYIEYRAVGFLYLLSVIIIGFKGTFGPILFSSIAGAITWNFIFIPPSYTLHVTEPEDRMMLLSFVLVGIFSGFLAKKAKTKEKLLIESEQKANALFNLLKDFSAAMDKESICELTEKNIRDLLRVEVKIILSNDNKTAINSVKDFVYPIIVSGKMLGSLVLNRDLKNELSPEKENLLSSICLQLGNALEHINLQEENKNLMLLEQSEKLHQILLNSVSHEMRIPLTSIIGTVNALQDLKIQTDPNKIQILNLELLESCDRLNRVIENILDMNRLNSGLLSIRKEWIEAADLIQSVISQIKSKNHKIKISEITQNIYLSCDVRLFEHALMNLLLNAISYSKDNSLIIIEIEKIEQKILIRILDEGPGIPEDKIALIFDKFYRLPGSPTGGIGLGLSIVKGIVEAHNGMVFVNNRTDRSGAVFTIELPWKRPSKELSEV